MMMQSLADTLTRLRLMDPLVLSFGFERGWVTHADVCDYAVQRLAAGESPRAAVELAIIDIGARYRIIDLLHQWAQVEGRPTQDSRHALRVWMFAALRWIASSGNDPEQQLDHLEDAYAALGYPPEMRECSRYFVPPADRAIPIGHTTDSPLEAMRRLLQKTESELGVPQSG